MYKIISDSLVKRIADGSVITASRDSTDYLAYLAWLQEGNQPQPADPPEVVVPTVVTAARGGLALIKSGRMQAVMSAVNAQDTPPEVKWAFDKAQEWNRDSELFSYVATKAGISDAELDDLFMLASTLTA